MVLCGGFADEKRAKKMRQDDGAEFISGSVNNTVSVISQDLSNRGGLVFYTIMM